MELFAWQTLIFLIPLIFGVLLVTGSIFGVGDGHTEADVHADHEFHAHGGDHSHDHAHGGHHHNPSLVGKALSALGVGRAPLMLVLATAATVFGATGIVVNAFLAPYLPVVYGFASLPLAFVGMVSVTGRFARFLGKYMPSTETYVSSKRDLIVGTTGELMLPADGRSGYAQVRDKEGNVQNITCRTSGETLLKNAQIIVLDYDKETDNFLVERFQLDSETKQ